jgi:DNA invertase Pin-like site-specific DNA recombinase
MIDNTNKLSFNPDEILTYLRKSRSDSPDETVEEVLEKHEEQLREYALHSLNLQLSNKYILREVVSGETIDARPQMLKLLKMIESPDIKAVYVIEPQRLSRGDLEDCGRLINILRFTKTLIITPGRAYDLEDKFDRKFFEMELTRGNDYLEYTKEILRRGTLASVKRGNYVGNIAPYGYRRVTLKESHKVVHTLEIIPEEAAALQIMFDLYVNRNYGVRRIASHLDELHIKPRKSDHWSPAALQSMIMNPVYIGKIRWNARKTVITIKDGQKKVSRPRADSDTYILVDGLHEPIIDEDIFYAAQAKKGTNVCVRKNLSLENPFAGLLFCQCGFAMSYKYNSNKKNIKASMLCNDQHNCHTRSVLYETFLQDVIKVMKNKIKSFDILIENNDMDNAERYQIIITDLENKLQKLFEKDARQKDALDDGIYSKHEYISRNSLVQEEIRKVKYAIEHTRENMPQMIDYKKEKATYEDTLMTIQDPNVSAEKKNTMLKKCISKIVYRNSMPSKVGIGRFSKNEFTLDVYFKV